ncbi:MAG: PQQ-like beta-propeller repeat protein, partial [Symploca sp. SIO2D2]|nr:PQQ-like beta-propeller repeat protein [Symploca sp. SIO2D2]
MKIRPFFKPTLVWLLALLLTVTPLSRNLALADPIVTSKPTITFTSPYPQLDEYFGSSVAIDGENVLIGAKGKNAGVIESVGEAYLFNASTGDCVQTFYNPDPQIGEYFGLSVAIDGENVLIGALAGEAYLFDASTGDLVQTFKNPYWQVGDYFGSSVAIDGENVLVGAKGKNAGVIESVGETYLFNASTGNLVQTFYNPSPQVDDYFGSSVAIDGENVLIGAEQKDVDGVLDVGGAYLFNASTGDLVQTFKAPDLGFIDFFGSSVTIDGENVLIGALAADVSGVTNAGEAYLFNASTGDLVQTFYNPSPQNSEYFGSSVAIDGENVLIGVERQTFPGRVYAGEAYLFDASTGNLLQTFKNPELVATGDFFGSSVAIDGKNVLIGGEHQEVAYLFKAANTNTRSFTPGKVKVLNKSAKQTKEDEEKEYCKEKQETQLDYQRQSCTINSEGKGRIYARIKNEGRNEEMLNFDTLVEYCVSGGVTGSGLRVGT